MVIQGVAEPRIASLCSNLVWGLVFRGRDAVTTGHVC
jgi:hypothetical protein